MKQFELAISFLMLVVIGCSASSGSLDNGDYCSIVISSEIREELELGPGQRAHMLLLQRDLRRGMRIEKRGMANPSWEYVLKKAERSRTRLGEQAKAALSDAQLDHFKSLFGKGKIGKVSVKKKANSFRYEYQPLGTEGGTAEYSRASKHVSDDLVREEFRSLQEGLDALIYSHEDVRVLAATFVRDANQSGANKEQVRAALKAAFEAEEGRAKGHLRDAIQKWDDE